MHKVYKAIAGVYKFLYIHIISNKIGKKGENPSTDAASHNTIKRSLIKYVLFNRRQYCRIPFIIK